MKKIATFFSLTILTIACATLLSCTSKNSEPDPVPGPVPTSQKLDMKYGIPALYDLHSVADVSVTYIDAAGKSITETLTSTPWEKEVKSISRPFTAKLTLTVKRKTGVTYDKKSYKIGSGYFLLFKKDSESADKYSDAMGDRIDAKAAMIPAKNIEKMLIRLETKPTVVTKKVPVLK